MRSGSRNSPARVSPARRGRATRSRPHAGMSSGLSSPYEVVSEASSSTPPEWVPRGSRAGHRHPSAISIPVWLWTAHSGSSRSGTRPVTRSQRPRRIRPRMRVASTSERHITTPSRPLRGVLTTGALHRMCNAREPLRAASPTDQHANWDGFFSHERTIPYMWYPVSRRIFLPTFIP